MTKISAALHVKQAAKRKTRSSVAAAGRGLDIPLAPPVMPLHCEAALRSASPFRRTTYTRTGGFCPGANPEFQRVARQNPPVLWLSQSACSHPEQPLSATHGRQRHNALDLASKIVYHETAGFIGFFLPRRALPSFGFLLPKATPPPLETTAKAAYPLWSPQPTGHSAQNAKIPRASSDKRTKFWELSFTRMEWVRESPHHGNRSTVVPLF